VFSDSRVLWRIKVWSKADIDKTINWITIYYHGLDKPMDKIEQARKIEEKRKKAYEEKKSKLTLEERKALEEYEADMLMSGFGSLMQKQDQLTNRIT